MGRLKSLVATRSLRLNPVALVLSLLLTTLALSRRERFVVGDIYADGYIVQEYWGSPIRVSEGLSVVVTDTLAFAITTLGFAVVLTYLFGAVWVFLGLQAVAERLAPMVGRSGGNDVATQRSTSQSRCDGCGSRTAAESQYCPQCGRELGATS